MSRFDLYPSRVGGEDAAVFSRKDPVVYTTTRADARDFADGPIPSAELRCYEESGALAIDPLLAADEVARLAERARELAIDPPEDAAEVIREPGSDVVRSIFAPGDFDALFAEFVRDARIRRIGEQVLGGPVYLHQCRINYKPAFEGKEFFWHSDFETWHVEDGMPRMRACSLSINLTDNRAENGPLMFIPGSHRHFVACPGETPADNFKRSLRRQEIGVPPPEVLEELARPSGVTSPTGPAGSAVLFDCNLMHGSNSNITPYPRTNLFLVLNSIENSLEAPFSGGPPRPSYIATRVPRVLG